MTLASLAEAIEWARPRWGERPVPMRTTVHDTEGELGGLTYSVAFARYLGAHAHDAAEVTEQIACHHVNHPIGVSLFECRGCQGSGVQTVRRWRYRYPMWNALARLSNARHDTPRHPHPVALVLVLAGLDWSLARAAERINRPTDTAEALFLVALRKLHGRYEEGPIYARTSWIAKSDSQRAAEEAAA